MKGTVNKLLCPGAAIFFLLAFAGCRKNITEAGNSPMTLSRAISGNLVADPDFTSWDANTNTLKDWSLAAAGTGVLSKESIGVSLSGNAPGPFYVYQRIGVDSQQYYEASVTAGYTINNYYSCGLYIMDSTLQNVLGKFERTNSSGTEETWKAIFYAKAKSKVALVLGFLQGINASTIFHHVSLTKYDYQPLIGGSDLVAHLRGKFPLEFSASQFDSSVCRIADYVNSVLLCRYTYYSDTVELPILDAMIGKDSAYSYFNQYRLLVDSLPVAYCQRSSLSLGEILTNEFHIPQRQVHMVFGNTGKHQFTEYWNPFTEKWIAVDPCFNVHYVKNNVLLGVEEFDRTEAPIRMLSFGTHVFHSFLPEDLPWYWENMDGLAISDHYTLSFPYADRF